MEKFKEVEEKDYTKISVYVSPADKKKIKGIGKKNGRSMSAQINFVVKQWLASQNGCTPHVPAENKVSQNTL